MFGLSDLEKRKKEMMPNKKEAIITNMIISSCILNKITPKMLYDNMKKDEIIMDFLKEISNYIVEDLKIKDIRK